VLVVVVEVLGGLLPPVVVVVVVVDAVVVVVVVIWRPLETVVGVLEGGTVAVDGTVDAVVVVDVEAAAALVSGLTHPSGGLDEPCCPGMTTVPAQPKFDKTVSPVTVEPSGRVYSVFCSRT
jgi:hypothetical protein